jgi:hypothetical protein
LAAWLKLPVRTMQNLQKRLRRKWLAFCKTTQVDPAPQNGGSTIKILHE